MRCLDKWMKFSVDGWKYSRILKFVALGKKEGMCKISEKDRKGQRELMDQLMGGKD